MPIQISRNLAFTLWTRPAQVNPIPMKNGLTAAGMAAAGASPPVSRPVRGQALSETPVASVPVAPVPFAHRLLPLAAAIVAVLGLHALMSAAESKRAALSATEVTGMNQMIDEAGRSLDQMKASNAKSAVEFAEKVAQIEAKALVLKEENGRLVSGLTQAQESIRKAGTRTSDLENLVRDLTKLTEEAKLAASTAETKAGSLVVAATEEASAMKREAAAEVVKLRESLARVEAEKAAAFKAAASAAQEKAALQQELDTLKKPAP